MSQSGSGTNARKSAPTPKMTPATMFDNRRPNRSAIHPPPAAPRTAPIRTPAVINSEKKSERPNSSLIERRAPEMTPMSYPKRNPPTAATTPTPRETKSEEAIGGFGMGWESVRMKPAWEMHGRSIESRRAGLSKGVYLVTPSRRHDWTLFLIVGSRCRKSAFFAAWLSLNPHLS